MGSCKQTLVLLIVSMASIIIVPGGEYTYYGNIIMYLLCSMSQS